jgi:hypothetical protein
MHPAASFEERSEALLQEMCEERLGCPMAWNVARAGRVGIAPIADKERTREVLEGICTRTRFDATLLLPEEEPDSWEEGLLLTEQISWTVLRCLIERARDQYTEQLPGLMQELQTHNGMMAMFQWKEEPDDIFASYSMLASPVQHTFGMNSAVLEFWNGERIDKLFSFVHAPYFLFPEGPKSHNRHSPHYCFVSTRESDFYGLSPDAFERLRSWTRSSGKGNYSQKMHPQIHLPNEKRGYLG